MSTATKDIRAEAILREYGRKPYQMSLEDPDDLNSGMSYVDSMNRVPATGMYDKRSEHQSEFKKPYLSDPDYSAMEYWYDPPFPNFAWPNMQRPPGGIVSVTTTSPWFNAHIPEVGPTLGCGIFCRGPKRGSGDDPCDEPIECGWSYASPSGKSPDQTARWGLRITETGEGFTPGKVVINNKWPLYKVKIYPPAGGWTDAVVTDDEAHLTVFFTDPDGSICADKVSAYCTPCACPSDPVFEFDDDNTPDTIVAGNSITLLVLNGCADFTYVVSGTGYTWAGSGTNTFTTSSRSAQLDCAAGT